MNYIKKVKVDGFWGERSIEFNFHDDINFIIGINGSGKTTAINMVVAALTADFSELDRMEFSRITIELKSKINKKKPSISIVKNKNKDKPFNSIEYEIKKSSGENPVVLSLDDYEEKIMLRRYPRHILERELARNYGHNIGVVLMELVNISWLSVHRASVKRNEYDNGNEKYDSSVDRKLRELSNRLVRYFSSLEKECSNELDNFQKEVFLSMLYSKTQTALFSKIKDLDTENEKKDLEKIFNQFNVLSKEFQRKLDDHFIKLHAVKEKLNKSSDIDLSDLYVLIGTERIDYIVNEWNKFLKKKNAIIEQRENFLNIINSLMQRKKFSISLQNEIEVITQSGKELPVDRLSSGEKQLLIVMGEALLQEKKAWVYIADEPELSLHVRWQESLVKNLRAINPNAQIIFATHSPDIVSIFSEKVFDMEKLFNDVHEN